MMTHDALSAAKKENSASNGRTGAEKPLRPQLGSAPAEHGHAFHAFPIAESEVRPEVSLPTPEGNAPTRLLDALLVICPGPPRGRAKQWIVAGRVTVNGVVVRKPHSPVSNQDEVVLGGRHATTLDCGSGWQIHPRVSLLYLDTSIAIVNKGPGLISVSAAEGDLSALSILADFLAGKLKAQSRSVAGKSLPPSYRRLQPLPVHRLDQYTSGVFCMAINSAARNHLIEQLKAHTMKREYVAYVEGRAQSQRGTWRQWLQLSQDELRQHVLSEAAAKAIGDEAREAITHYEVIDEYPLAGGKRFASKLRLRLETGRKHQIRVQAANAGLPLIGDRTYNTAVRSGPAEGHVDFPRQALHAQLLTLEHPDKPGSRIVWTAALPKDLRNLEAVLRSGRPAPGNRVASLPLKKPFRIGASD